MAMRLSHSLSLGRLRLFLALLFVALMVPSAVLIDQTRHQLKWETFHQYRTLADELGRRIDAALQRMIDAEEARGYADYEFVVLTGDPHTSKLLQRSPLARYPVQSALPGLIGYFQIDADGAFSTPLLPDDLSNPDRWGLGAIEIGQRVALRDSMLDVLNRNRLLVPQPSLAAPDVRLAAAINHAASPNSESSAAISNRGQASPMQQIASPAAFDELKAPAEQAARTARNQLGRVDDLQMAQNYQRAADEYVTQNLIDASQTQLKSKVQARAKRTEQSAVVEPQPQPHTLDNAVDARRVRIFESEVDPFEFSLLDNGYGLLYRKVWRNGKRTIQGAIIDQNAFLDAAVVDVFEETALAQMSDLAVAYQHGVVRFARGPAQLSGVDVADGLQGELLHQARLSAPMGDFLLLWNINQLPTGPGGQLINWAGAVLLAVLVVGFVLLYRLGVRQILLGRQQQDFVSAVSHELNTPLTSIRMYAEMLDAGWASEDKKSVYYRFIHDESERLTRLIANVLQLARMERNELRLDLKAISVDTLLDVLRSKLTQQIERSGFECIYQIAPDCVRRELLVDVDAFVQIVINLVDNALKFSARAQRRMIEISVHTRGERRIAISVRDYGPGVDKSQLRKIFALFYRSRSELTRETPGTGIGLALVRQLARAMGGDVEVVNRDPGAEFQLLLPSTMQPRESVTDAPGRVEE
ncbi:MAG: HAMP domain-containing sensor histidine kinase [Pseudomonadota bacterium]|nr:HAMP domain-containing sensor histidine kinase [Pseudomonadota bacterium]